ncbi:hypothetical protein KUTeg_019267 [Tegillarca granosa]|uniref:Uncharacterized protein n=1 Tax=Tegillarca granosa TaxID=220873 RepID=A0ABQ9EC03_TEGGR|nr:hypothetical protein KUTeg_019267 [Tegillarca granosa]
MYVPINIYMYLFIYSSVVTDVGFDGLFPHQYGFIDNILNKYFKEYFPRAISLAEQLKNGHYHEKFIYTTHPWLVSLYLDCPPDLNLAEIKLQCPTAVEVSKFEEAIKAGYITWHAGPMNMQFEMMDPSIAKFSLQLSEDLDKRFDIVRKHRTLSQRDVPGTTQALIPLLVEAGIEAISVGVNGVTSPPAVPPIFRWEFQNKSVIGLWHPGGYPDDPGTVPLKPGGLSKNDCTTFPGITHALCFAFRTDNSGPPKSIQEILGNYEVARSQFTKAIVQASTFEDFIEAVQPIKSKLPIVTKEIGDTWIQGIASDPRKVAEMRAIFRARSKCLQNNTGIIYNASRFFVKPPEHTWGCSSVFDRIHWTNKAFYEILEKSPMYIRYGIKSWIEQRQFLYLGIDALGNHSLSEELQQKLEMINAEMPSFTGYKLLSNKYSVQSCGGFTLQFNKDGAMSKLIDPLTKVKYIIYVENCSFIAHINVTDEESTSYYGAPRMIFIKYDVTNTTFRGVTEPKIDVELQWFKKPPTRLPEAIYYKFKPVQNSGGSSWMIHKLGQWIDPLNVIMNGSQRLHAINEGVMFMKDKSHSMKIVSLDAALVNILSPGLDISTMPLPLTPLKTVDGVAFNLYNNVWDVNYIFWYPFLNQDNNQKFRFSFNFMSGKEKSVRNI